MSEKYFRVGVHGPPDPDEHPWVMAKFAGDQWRLIHVPDFPGRHWGDGEYWYPVEAPPSELAPEPEGVGRLARNVAEYLKTHRDYVSMSKRQVAAEAVRVALEDARHEAVEALGLVDQPSVEWVTDRLPNDDERPVLWRDDEGMYWLRYGEGFFSEGDPWVSLSVLLDAAGLGER